MPSIVLLLEESFISLPVDSSSLLPYYADDVGSKKLSLNCKGSLDAIKRGDVATAEEIREESELGRVMDLLRDLCSPTLTQILLSCFNTAAEDSQSQTITL